jgi:hypothetical protein
MKSYSVVNKAAYLKSRGHEFKSQQVFCNLLQIIEGLPRSSFSIFYIYIYSTFQIYSKIQIKFVIVQRKKNRAMCCTIEISLPPTSSVDSIHIGME